MTNVQNDQELMDELIRHWPDMQILRVKGNIVDDGSGSWVLSIHGLVGDRYMVFLGSGPDHHSALADLVNRAVKRAKGEDELTPEDAPF